MKESKWSWKDVAEIIGVVGVVASLMFVAYQVRQNTRAIESSTVESILGHSYDAAVLTVENADLRTAQYAACAGVMSEDQQRQLSAYYRALLTLQLNRYFQIQLGVLDQQTVMALGSRATPYRRPVFAQIWQQIKADYDEDFQAFVESQILPMVRKTC